MFQLSKGFIFLAALAVASCSTTGKPPAEPDAAEISSDMLLTASPLSNRSQFVDLSGLDMLEVTADMAEFLDRSVDAKRTEQTLSLIHI